ncbi:MAG: ribbon-helix-helix domain-containing protein [Coriobacteriia bacterium]|nr:ribbon-helix-helix domain-containing protein [Coriobacteriia bacterium]
MAQRVYARLMKKTMMYLPEELHRFLAEEAERRGVSMAEIAREAIGEYRTRSETTPKHNYMAIVGIIDVPGPPTNDSERVDEILDEYYKVGGKWDQEHGLADPD